MSAEIKIYSPEQAFTLNRFQRVAALYSKLDTHLRDGKPLEVSKDEHGNQFRTHAEDTPFTLVFDARGVYGLYRIRRGLRQEMEDQGMGELAEEILTSYNGMPKEANIRAHIAATGGY